jgi:hypothetical protein
LTEGCFQHAVIAVDAQGVISMPRERDRRHIIRALALSCSMFGIDGQPSLLERYRSILRRCVEEHGLSLSTSGAARAELEQRRVLQGMSAIAWHDTRRRRGKLGRGTTG